MTSRRKFLALSGASISAPFLSSISAAEENKDAKQQVVNKLLRENKKVKAKQFAAENGIDLHHHRVNKESEGDSQDISPTDWFTNPGDNGTRVDFFVTSPYGDECTFTLDWELMYDDTNVVDGASPKDAAVIAWEDSQWGLESLSSVSHAAYGTAGDGTRLDVSNSLAGGGLIGERQNAIGLKIQDMDLGHPSGVEKMNGYLQLKTRKQNFPNRADGRVECLYKHTWSVLDNAHFNFLENVSINKGPLSVKLDTFSDSWDFRHDISL